MRSTQMRLFSILWLLIMGALWALPACKSNPDCDDALILTQVFPNTNPAGGPVLLKGSGFRSGMSLNFGNVSASIGEFNDSFLVAQVPGGLLGGVRITLSDGGCNDQIGFDVASSFPVNLPASPPVYLLPQPGLAFSILVTSDETIPLQNVYDPTHAIYLRNSGSVEEIIGEGLDAFSHENFSGWYGINPPNDTVIRASAINDQSTVYITLDRNMSNGRYLSDEWVGSFQTLFNVNIDGNQITDNFFVAFSTLNGRQYLFR